MSPLAPIAQAESFALPDHASHWKGRERFVVLDVHFNPGANFLATWNAWRADPHGPQQLHYLAIVDFPFTAPALMQAHAEYQELPALSRELIATWPVPVPGFHRIFLEGGSVALTLIFGERKKSLSQIDAHVDAFYVSSPCAARDPESEVMDLFILLGRLAAPQAMLAIDSRLRADAQAAKNSGFEWENESIGKLARFVPRRVPRPARIIDRNQRHAIVIGAGLAGSAACERLAARNWRISLIERHNCSANEASGNLAGIFMPYLTQDDNPGARLSRAAFMFALHLWQRIGGIGTAFAGETCGVLQLARDEARAKIARNIIETGKYPAEFAQWLNADAVLDASGLRGRSEGEPAAFRHGGWLFPRAGWAQPGELCEALLLACGDRLTRYFARRVTRIERIAGNWQAFDERGSMIAQAPHLIMASGAGARALPQAAGLPLDAVRGQVTYVRAAALPALPMVICGDGYATPPFDGMCSVGASYDADDDPFLRQESQRQNLARLEQIAPGTAVALADMPLAGRVGFRCVSADRLPLAGALPDPAAAFRCERLRDVPRIAGLYGLLGYASRGLIWAPIAAELLAAQMSGDPLPLERKLAAAVDPARFYLAGRRRLIESGRASPTA